MRSHKVTSALVLALTLWVGIPQVAAEPILGVIDISSIRNRHPGAGNSLGVAYSPISDVLYLSQFVTPSGPPFIEGYIYTLDLQGNLLHELNFQNAYRAGWYPESLSYDRGSGHLFVFASDFFAVSPGVGKIVEMSPDGAVIYNEFTVSSGGGGGIHVRDDGIWQSLFASDTIRHFTRDGTLIEELSVANSFPGFPGPEDLTSSFMRGFFLVSSFASKVVEVDIAGNEITSVSTASLGSFLSIDSDVDSRRLFLQNNGEIYVLSSEFIKGIPEPSTLTLFCIGSLGMIAYTWRRPKRGRVARSNAFRLHRLYAPVCSCGLQA